MRENAVVSVTLGSLLFELQTRRGRMSYRSTLHPSVCMCFLSQGPESLWYQLKGGWSKPLNGPKDRPQWARFWSTKNHTFLCVLEWVSERTNTCCGARNGARERCGVSDLVDWCEQTKHYGLEQPDFGALKIILSHKHEFEWMSEQMSERSRAWAKQAVLSRQTEWSVRANKRTDKGVAQWLHPYYRLI